MRKLLIAFAMGSLIAVPAQATGGLVCSTSGARPVTIALVVSHTAVPAIVSARLTDNGREVPVMAAQSWLDPTEVRIDLTDRNAMRHEARLRATWRKASRSYDGSLWRGGRRHWVRCREA